MHLVWCVRSNACGFIRFVKKQKVVDGCRLKHWIVHNWHILFGKPWITDPSCTKFRRIVLYYRLYLLPCKHMRSASSCLHFAHRNGSNLEFHSIAPLKFDACWVKISSQKIWCRLPSEPYSSSWWFQPIWKICSSNWIISQGFGVNIKK